MDAQTTEEMDGTLADTIPDPSAGIEEQADRAEVQAAVRQRVEALPMGREMVVLCDLEGKTTAEAAAMLGMPAQGPEMPAIERGSGCARIPA